MPANSHADKIPWCVDRMAMSSRARASSSPHTVFPRCCMCTILFFPTYRAMYQSRNNKSQPLLLHQANLYHQNYRDILVAISPLVLCFSSDKIKGIRSGIGFRPANLPHHFHGDQMTGFLLPNGHPCNIVSRLRLYICPVLVSPCLPFFPFLLDVSHSSVAAQ